MPKGLKEKKLGRLQPSQQSVELLNDANSDQRNEKTEDCEYLLFKSYVSTIRIHVSTHAIFFIIIIHAYGRIQHSAPWDNAFILSVSTPDS